MNLKSTIRRDGTKVHYLHIAEEVEARTTLTALFLGYWVSFSNKVRKQIKLT
jgi:hypothetical protein